MKPTVSMSPSPPDAPRLLWTPYDARPLSVLGMRPYSITFSNAVLLCETSLLASAMLPGVHMPRLTKRLVDGLQPGPGDYFVWDASVPGFGLRIFPSGRKSYLIQYRDTHGRTRRYALGPHG